MDGRTYDLDSLGVAACVALGIGCIIWAAQGKPLSENPHHDEY